MLKIPQQLMEAAQALAGRQDQDVPTLSQASELHDLAEAMLRQSENLDSRRKLVRKALGEMLRDPHGVEPYVWIRDMFPESAVYEYGEKLYQCGYAVEGDKATVSDVTEVEVAYVPIASAAETEMTEAGGEDLGEVITLQEAAVAADGTVNLKLISPGWGSSGYYPADVLKRDGPKVFTEGTKMFADHQTDREAAERPEGSIKDLAAVLTSNATWQESGADGPGLYAKARVMKAWQGPIDDMAKDIGVSIRGLGVSKFGEAEGRKGPIVQSIVGRKSVDFVTDAGRGGKILTLREAATKRQADTKPQQLTGKEGAMPLTEAEAQALKESVANLQTQTENLALENARLKEAAILREAREFVAAKLPGSLPELTRARLVESLAKNPPVKDGAIDADAFATQITEAAKAEVDYLAKVTGSGQIRDMGSFQESKPEAKPEEVTASLTESFKTLGLDDQSAELAAKGRA